MGTSAFSEIENQNVRDFLAAHKDTIKYYVNLHSYSQLVLLPWGYTKDPMPVYDRYLEVANRVSHLKILLAFVDNKLEMVFKQIELLSMIILFLGEPRALCNTQ